MHTKNPRGKTPCGAETRTCHCGHHQVKDHEPQRGKCRLCDCRGFKGRPCTETKRLGAGGRCWRHGGDTPVGKASPNWKNGRWSAYLPQALAERFQEGLADPFLMQIRQDVALTDMLLTTYTQKLKPGKPITRTQEKRIVELSEHRRKLIESDAKRQRELQQLIPVERVMQLVTAMATMCQELMPRELLPKAQARMKQLLMGQGQTIDVATEGESA